MIIHEVRLPRTITAVLVGAALGVTGLFMQTLFRSPLADPYVLGISSGASLGVALVVLLVGVSPWAASFTAGIGLGGDLGMTVAAAGGSAAVMGLGLFAGRFVSSSHTLAAWGDVWVPGLLPGHGLSLGGFPGTGASIPAVGFWKLPQSDLAEC